MSDDPGEKFYMEYWQFEGSLEESIPPITLHTLRPRDEEGEVRLLVNASWLRAYRPAFALHTQEGLNGKNTGDLEAPAWRLRRGAAAVALAILKRQDFACPTGTSSCASINYPNTCCAEGETCFQIEDTGLGPVGCCPSGASCGGSVNTCPSPNTACADGQNSGFVGGGCCIPGYVCAGVGCAVDPSLVVTVVTTETVVMTSSSSTATSVEVSTITSTKETSTDTALQTTLACSSGFHACPVNLGGGCCKEGFTCGSFSICHSGSTSSSESSSSSSTPTSTSLSSATGGAAIRPTGLASTSSNTHLPGTTCPVGFYACSATYGGNCCRTGRDCDTTSCPSTSSTTIISSGLTVAVPVGPAATVASPSGECANGWSTCAASVGGNCCPSGWECGTASCSSVGASATKVEQKSSPNGGGRVQVALQGVMAVIWIGYLGVYLR